MYDESIKSPATSDDSIAPGLNYVGNKITVKFEGSILNKIKSHLLIKREYIYIIYEIHFWDQGYDDYPTLENYFFGVVKLVKNANIDKCKYSGYGIGFGGRGTFSVANGFGKNTIIFGVDVSSSAHVDNKEKDILILGGGPTKELDDTILTAKKVFNQFYLV